MVFKEEAEDSDSSDAFKVPYKDRDSLGRARQALGISMNYVPRWDRSNGFREFYQNWFDIRSFQELCEHFQLILKYESGRTESSNP
jgi:hypothetical protein